MKWDLYPGTLPMWVADMDFEVAPEIKAALQKRLDHGVFGYELVPDAYFEAIARWFAQRHGWEGIGRENIVPTTGVIAAYSAAIKAMTVPGDKVLVMTPCYNAFFPAIRNNKCEQLVSPLRYDGTRYIVDWDDFEAKAREAAAAGEREMPFEAAAPAPEYETPSEAEDAAQEYGPSYGAEDADGADGGDE